MATRKGPILARERQATSVEPQVTDEAQVLTEAADALTAYVERLPEHSPWRATLSRAAEGVRAGVLITEMQARYSARERLQTPGL